METFIAFFRPRKPPPSQLDRIERQQGEHTRKLDQLLRASALEFRMETANMTTLSDLTAQSAAILAKAERQDDLTLAISQNVTDLKALYAQVKADLDALIAAGNPSQAELEALAANLTAIDAAIDADEMAKAVIKGTEADPNA